MTYLLLRRNLKSWAILTFFSASASYAQLPDNIVYIIKSQAPSVKANLLLLEQNEQNLLRDRFVQQLWSAFGDPQVQPISEPLRLEMLQMIDKQIQRYETQTRLYGELGLGEKDSANLGMFLMQGVKNQKADRQVSRLIQAFDGELRGNYLYLNLSCFGMNKKFKIPFKIEKQEMGLRLQLHGIPMIGMGEDGLGDEVCIDMTFEHDRTSHVDALSSRRIACPIPGPKPGNCLLKIVEDLSREAKLDRIALDDGSAVSCSKNRAEVNLRILKIFQQGKGWYEKNGYLPKNPSEYYSNVKAFTSYLLVELIQDLEMKSPIGFDRINSTSMKDLMISNLEMHQKVARLLKEDLKTYSESAKVNASQVQLGPFMSWLWDQNCANYAQIEIILNTYVGTPIPIQKLYPRVKSLVKTLK